MDDDYTESLWRQRVMAKKSPLPKENTLEIIMNYFIVEGYSEVAKIFKKEAGTLLKNDDMDLYLTEERSTIINSILNHKSQHGLEVIETLNIPSVDKKEYLRYVMNQASFLDLIYENKSKEAMEFAQTHLYTPKLENDEERCKDLEDFMMLLLYEDPSKSNSNFLKPKFRESTANVVNKNIIAEACKGLSFVSKLEVMFRSILKVEAEFKTNSIPHVSLFSDLFPPSILNRGGKRAKMKQLKKSL